MTRKKRRAKTATIRSCPRSPVGIFFACLVLLLTISEPSQGKGKDKDRPKPKDYALIFGTVWGPDDRPVPGVTIKIRRVQDKNSKVRWQVSSDRRGEFAQRVPVGKQDYVIWADLKGYKSAAYKHLQAGEAVTVHVESNERADTGLHLK